MNNYLLAIDQGTSSTRAIIFDANARIVGQHQQAFSSHFPHNGWVEHDPEEIWRTVLECCRQALSVAKLDATAIDAIGIANQRETTIVWDKNTGEPVYPAIVWQDRRTAGECQRLVAAGLGQTVQQITGLIIDPYFSATKIAWILTNIPGAHAKASRGELLFGTVDTFLIWRLTGGKVHVTDVTNAARTMLYDLRNLCFDENLLHIFDIPAAMLPAVVDSAVCVGTAEKNLLGAAIPICGIAGDQQAAAFGQACWQAGSMKSTYGTGCFMLLNTGEQIIQSQHQLLSTILYRINGRTVYGLEGSIFIAGAAVQWLQDNLKIITSPEAMLALVQQITDTHGVYFVPSFTGLGAPYWKADARGAIVGLTRESGVAHIVRAALEAAAYQTRDLLAAMLKDTAMTPALLRVDGGMSTNSWLLQFLSDILGLTVQRAAITETSALGAALLAGLGAGLYTSLESMAALCGVDQIFTPSMSIPYREQLYAGWLTAVKRVSV